MVVLKRQCPLCGKTQYMAFTDDQYVRVKEYIANRQLFPIQDGLPDLTADQREFILSGVCNDCWGKYDD